MTKLVTIQIQSIYPKSNPTYMPSKMALCTPDTKIALFGIQRDVEAEGGKLFLSDLFRTHDMQFQAHWDWVTKKKEAYSPPAGSGMHEAGRAFDIDLTKIKITLKRFWEIASKYGVYPIISEPKINKLEAWHFDKRGSHNLIYQYYKSGKGKNLEPYTAMAISAILSAGIDVDTNALGDQDFLKGKNTEAFIQSGLIRLGYDIGNIDGSLGVKSNTALQSAGIITKEIYIIAALIEDQLRVAFSEEYI
jgi:hypothetical protein